MFHQSEFHAEFRLNGWWQQGGNVTSQVQDPAEQVAVREEAPEAISPQRGFEAPPALSARLQVWTTLVALLLITGLLLAGNVMHNLGDGSEEGIIGVFAPIAWEGDFDGSHIEVWGHIQMLAAGVVLLVLSVVHRASVFSAWALVSIVIVIDDLFQIHEKGGEYLAVAWELQPAFRLRDVDFGELIVWTAIGTMLLIPLVIGHLRANKWARRQSWTLLGILVLLAVFAVGVDMLIIIVYWEVPWVVIRLLALTETAGEIIPMALYLTFVIKLAVMPDQPMIRRRSRRRASRREETGAPA